MHLFPLKTLDLSPKATSTVSQRLSSSLLTPRSSHHFITLDKQDELVISATQLEQLLRQLKKDLVTQAQVIETLREGSAMLKRKELEYRELDLPKEIANLNRIKEDNERILKNRIRYLEDKLRKLGITEMEIQVTRGTIEENQIKNLKTKLDKKNKEIDELGKEIRMLEKQLKLINTNKNMFEAQKIKLINIIQGLEFTIKSQLQTKEKEKEKLKSIIIQTDHYHEHHRQPQPEPQPQPQPQPKPRKLRANSDVVSLSIYGEGRGQSEKSARVAKLMEEVNALQSSNSAIRKEMVHMHSFLEEQDERYQRTIEKLEAKIKKLTEFNNSKPRSMGLIEGGELCHSRFMTPTRRNSDLSNSLIFRNQREKRSPNIIKVADFNLKFQLSKTNIEQLKNEEDTKISLEPHRNDSTNK